MSEVELVFPFELGKERPWVLPPLGLGYLAAVLGREGINCGITDCTFMGIDAGLREVLHRQPKIVGIYSMVTLGRNADHMARALRKNVDFLVAGGPLPTVYPERFLRYFDFCMRGEAEGGFARLARDLLNGGDGSGIDGVASRANGAKAVPQRIRDLKGIPHPLRSDFPNDRYRDYWEVNFGYSPASIIATRGCPYRCDFCSRPVSGDHFRVREPNDILDEVGEIRTLGYDYLWFADDAFTYDTGLVLGVSEGLREAAPGIRWDCLSRTDGVDDELAQTMRRGGLERVYLGIESGSDETLRLMRKGARVADAENAIMRFARQGVKVGGFFMVGYPGETPDSIWSTVRFSARRELDYISYTVPYPLPGSPLYDRVREQVDPGMEWSHERENALLFKSDFPEAALREVIRLALEAHGLARREGRERALNFLDSKESEYRRLLEAR
jgi:anaerobic magnesium-protoporphyrin IX monomethyl ester cyclase